MDNTTYFSNTEIISAITEEFGEKSELLEYDYDDGEYLCNLDKNIQKAIKNTYGEELPSYSLIKPKIRFLLMDGHLKGTDGEVLLQDLFYQRKGLSLDSDSAKEMIPIFESELDDQYNAEDEINNRWEHLLYKIDNCSWENEETVINSFWDDIASIYEQFNDEQRNDDVIIDILIKILQAKGYYDLHKLGVDNYLIIDD